MRVSITTKPKPPCWICTALAISIGHVSFDFFGSYSKSRAKQKVEVYPHAAHSWFLIIAHTFCSMLTSPLGLLRLCFTCLFLSLHWRHFCFIVTFIGDNCICRLVLSWRLICMSWCSSCPLFPTIIWKLTPRYHHTIPHKTKPKKKRRKQKDNTQARENIGCFMHQHSLSSNNTNFRSSLSRSTEGLMINSPNCFLNHFSRLSHPFGPIAWMLT